ncbi:hypothetical protein OAI98_01785 [Gammaproteobacteria bacterium]|jgi:hypothetical protein|uniref:Uncharacterized protein n=1 Tax=uncultured marine bacterium EB0_39H12 TaxID=415437 RepID=A4GHZ1_9BACT|nr:hypothetical protein MBMO_EB0-39H12.0078 [uncultured marine bacterium EB0_39H12]MDC0141535.1 hypothetical protein [Gammaproteobacteria bacterium]|tara:strand:+ start:488 stop:829 length:342 start_codon:yes stop_codon:yes gene_type:complete
MNTQRFELTEDEIRLIALYRKKELTDANYKDDRILNIKQSMEFIDKFRVLIEAEREMKINSEIIYRYLFRVLSLFKDRCNYFGLDARTHVLDILDETEKGSPSSENERRPSLN